ncbi:hypothetical protein [Myxococcus fulvus]|uniref:hypothetical protein n=1 Tax=Myxococcus fulvus TaxID=33 RepID=UPI0020BFB9FC|nr:hypothetical protein [Myxococcus fulvus]MCK8499645.1 hypothetical protein [Myxococcus fulvus]
MSSLPFPIGPNPEPFDYLRDKRERTDEQIGAVASAMYLAKWFCEARPQLRKQVDWFRADQGLLSKLPQVQGGILGASPVKQWSAHEEIPPRLAQMLRPLLDLEATVRDLHQVMERLADILDALEQQPQLASLLSTHGKRQLMVAFADVTTSLLGIKQFGGRELAAVSVLVGEEAHSERRDSDALTACMERWKNARREAREVRELLQQLLGPAAQPAGVISISTASAMEAGSPSTTTPSASPHPEENTGETD